MVNPIRSCRECLATRSRREWGVLWSAYLVFWGALTGIFVIHLEVMTFYLPPGIRAFGADRGLTIGHPEWVELCEYPADLANETCNRFENGADFAVAKANVKTMQFDSQKQDLALAIVPLPGSGISPTPWIKSDAQICGADGETSCLSDYSAAEREGGTPEIISDGAPATQQIRLLAQWDSRRLAGDVNVRCYDSGSNDAEAYVETGFAKVYSAPVFGACTDPYSGRVAESAVATCETDATGNSTELRVMWGEGYHAPQIFQYTVLPTVLPTAEMGAAVRVTCTTMGELVDEDYAGIPWLRNSDTQAIEVEYEFVWSPL